MVVLPIIIVRPFLPTRCATVAPPFARHAVCPLCFCPIFLSQALSTSGALHGVQGGANGQKAARLAQMPTDDSDSHDDDDDDDDADDEDDDDDDGDGGQRQTADGAQAADR